MNYKTKNGKVIEKPVDVKKAEAIFPCTNNAEVNISRFCILHYVPRFNIFCTDSLNLCTILVEVIYRVPLHLKKFMDAQFCLTVFHYCMLIAVRRDSNVHCYEHDVWSYRLICKICSFRYKSPPTPPEKFLSKLNITQKRSKVRLRNCNLRKTCHVMDILAKEQK